MNPWDDFNRNESLKDKLSMFIIIKFVDMNREEEILKSPTTPSDYFSGGQSSEVYLEYI